MKKSLAVLLLSTVCLMLSGCGSSGGNDGPTVAPIPDAGPTVLPAFYGAAVGPAPIAPSLVPQNPFLAPNPFSNVHSDTWMSDTVGFVGPLGRDPAVFSSTLVAARRNPNSPTFICSSIAFDSAGRLVMSCAGSQEASLVLADPDTLAVLASVNLPLSASAANATSSAYTYLDQQDRIVVGAADNTIKVMQVVRGETGFSFQKVAEYDVSPFIHPDANGNPDSLIGVMPDWQGRIWFAIRASATVGVIDTARYPAASSIQTFALNDGGEIKNGFAVNQTDAYVVSTKAMYRIATGPDGIPRQVWSAGYGNIGTVKPGQYSAGSGTTPTLLGHGEYVAIADNDAQTHVVVYRTAEPLAAGQNRTGLHDPRVRVRPGRRGGLAHRQRPVLDRREQLRVPGHELADPGQHAQPAGDGARRRVAGRQRLHAGLDQRHGDRAERGAQARDREWTHLHDHPQVRHVAAVRSAGPGCLVLERGRLSHRRRRLGAPRGHWPQVRQLVSGPGHRAERHRLFGSIRRADRDQGYALAGDAARNPSRLSSGGPPGGTTDNRRS